MSNSSLGLLELEFKFKIAKIQYQHYLRRKGRGGEWKVEEGREDVWKGENKKNVEDLI
jgi:hypothetical protein